MVQHPQNARSNSKRSRSGIFLPSPLLTASDAIGIWKFVVRRISRVYARGSEAIRGFAPRNDKTRRTPSVVVQKFGELRIRDTSAGGTAGCRAELRADAARWRARPCDGRSAAPSRGRTATSPP